MERATPRRTMKNNFLTENWTLMVGVSLGALTLFFLMALVVMAILGYEIPNNSKFLITYIISFGMAFSTAFIGGHAAAKGNLPPIFSGHPFSFSVGGGVAVFFLTSIIVQKSIIPPIDEVWDRKLSSLKTAQAQLSQVDDEMILKINGEIVENVKYGDVRPWINIKNYLTKGANRLEVTILNGPYGGCGGKLQLMFNKVEEQEFNWIWSNPFGSANSICISEVKTLNVY